MQQNKHEFLPRERCYFMGHEVFTKKKESKIRTFLLSRERGREGRFNSLNFNWIEIIVSLSRTLKIFQFSKMENISSQPLPKMWFHLSSTVIGTKVFGVDPNFYSNFTSYQVQDST